MEISNGRHQLTASYSVREPLPGLGCPIGYLSQEINPPLPMPPPPGHPHEALRCPRCDSNNTKFCYYNNYSLSQPRYFCKGCRRYWTKGGTLRNVPVGGGCRKNKRSSSSSSPSSSPSSTSSKKLTLHQENRDSFNLPLPPIAQNGAFLLPNPNPNPSGFLDILRCGMTGPADPPPAISGLPDLYYGFGAGSEDNGVMLPFNHGVSVSDSTMAEGAHAGAGTSHGSYWNGAGAGSWHGFLVHDGA